MLANAYIGFDVRMPDAYMVAVRSIMEATDKPITIRPLLLPHLRAQGAYTRATKYDSNGKMHDVISDAPMSTQFAISRFLIPALQGYKGLSLFCDSDFMFRSDIHELFERFDPRLAVACVQHKHEPVNGVKMDGEAQTVYPRKNWSSLMLINNEHPANRWLTIENVNSVPGRDLHAFCWLKDHQIGALDPAWNWLEGHSSMDINPKAVHYTRGTPDMAGYENTPYSNQWRDILGRIV